MKTKNSYTLKEELQGQLDSKIAGMSRKVQGIAARKEEVARRIQEITNALGGVMAL